MPGSPECVGRPGGLPGGLPAGLPGGLPTDLRLPAGLPGGLPTGFGDSVDFGVGVPIGLPIGLPVGRPRGFPPPIQRLRLGWIIGWKVGPTLITLGHLLTEITFAGPSPARHEIVEMRKELNSGVKVRPIWVAVEKPITGIGVGPARAINKSISFRECVEDIFHSWTNQH